VRVAYWYANAGTDSVGIHVRQYAFYNIGMNLCEIAAWSVGTFYLPEDSQYRWAVFLVGILFSMRVPRAFLANDFHGACSKLSVLFILLLGFLLQNIVLVASPFFNYGQPSMEEYTFLGVACLMLFCIKLLYVDDFGNISDEDHALLVNRWAGFFFYFGQFALLLSTTVLGAGLNLLTRSFLAATEALPNDAKSLTCGGFASVIASIAFIKSMHVRRVPIDGKQQAMFMAAYGIQIIVMVAVVFLSVSMCMLTTEDQSFLASLMVDEIQMLSILSGFALCLVVTQWLDEGVELSLYNSTEDSKQYLVQPFGFWWCLTSQVTKEKADAAIEGTKSPSTPGLSKLGSPDGSMGSMFSPLLGSPDGSMKISQLDLDYDSMRADLEA